MNEPIGLPAGATQRPLSVDDVDAVVALANECELLDSGEIMWERADLLSDIALEGFDPRKDWIGVFDGDRLVGWAILVHRHHAWIDVKPGDRGRGIGSWLRAWSEARATEIGAERVGSTIDDRLETLADSLRRAGYTPRHTSWILRINFEERPDDPTPPAGIELRGVRAGEEDAVLAMFEEAFSEWADRLPSTPSMWRTMTIEREGFVPDDLVVAADDDGRIAGGAFLIDADEIWVDKLATSPAFRHRGVARALLQVAFQRSFDRGYRQTSLSTDSRTGALALYQHVGMRVHSSYTHYALDL